MKKIFILFIFCSGFSVAQNPGEWMWIHGSSSPGSYGNFGIQGVPSAANEPPALYEPCEWIDLNGNFWMLGGKNVTGYFCCDLWKYDPISNEWTWMKGTAVMNQYDPGNYGTLGVPSLSNYPPSVGFGVPTWVDNQGDLWMYSGPYNNVWKYNIATNIWTWMEGYPSGTATFGTQGIADSTSNPGGGYERTSAWTSNNGDLWLFGGEGYGIGNIDALWNYNIASGEWTWIKGASIANQPGVYGTLGVESSFNTPGARWSYTHWKDNSGNLWLFGGNNNMSNITPINDMWRYNPSTNNWTWMGGSATANANGIYGTKCYAAPTNIPGARFENRAVFTDSHGNFWMFGGARGNGIFTEVWNDLWLYDPTSNQWIWESGDSISNSPGNWGVPWVSNPLNKPSGRGGAIMWGDNNGHLYVFGGSVNNPNGVTPYNDLWKYAIDTTCINNLLPSAIATVIDDSICPGTCIYFLNHSTNAISYQWSFSGATPPISTDVNPTNICYTTPGSYDAQLIAYNANGSDTLLLTNYITVYPFPPAQAITQSGDTLFAISGATSYQWYFNGNIINGAMDYFYIAPASGDYNVVATDGNGCEVEAVVFNVVANAEVVTGSSGIVVFPNPVSDKVKIHKSKFTRGTAPPGVLRTFEISIYNVIGERVLTVLPPLSENDEQIIDVSILQSGMYWIEIVSGEKTFRAKFIKE